MVEKKASVSIKPHRGGIVVEKKVSVSIKPHRGDIMVEKKAGVLLSSAGAAFQYVISPLILVESNPDHLHQYNTIPGMFITVYIITNRKAAPLQERLSVLALT